MKKITVIILCCLLTGHIFSQEPDLLNMVDSTSSQKRAKEYVPYTFKSTRNINFHTCEILGPKSLDFRISHRFGPINSGAYNAWGIDGPANLMLSLEYSYDGRMMVGVQRSLQDKMGNLFFKAKLLRQAKYGSPVTITYFGGAYNTFVKDPYLGQPEKLYQKAQDRFSYVHQLIIARKFAPWLSAQLSPFYVHYNLVGEGNGLELNDIFGLAAVLRFKYNKRQSIIFEYAYRFNRNYESIGSKYYDSMGIGWEIETGGHVFQIFFTNSFGIVENQYLVKTDGDASSMGIRLGFNITRVFPIGGRG